MGGRSGLVRWGRGQVLAGLVKGRPSYDAVCLGPDGGGEGYAGVEEPAHPGGVQPGGEVAHAHTVVGAVDDGDGVAGTHQAGFVDLRSGGRRDPPVEGSGGEDASVCRVEDVPVRHA
jgi:hypothetical protein